MTEEECLQKYEFHSFVPITTETDGLRLKLCIRCNTEEFEEVQID